MGNLKSKLKQKNLNFFMTKMKMSFSTQAVCLLIMGVGCHCSGVGFSRVFESLPRRYQNFDHRLKDSTILWKDGNKKIYVRTKPTKDDRTGQTLVLNLAKPLCSWRCFNRIGTRWEVETPTDE